GARLEGRRPGRALLPVPQRPRADRFAQGEGRHGPPGPRPPVVCLGTFFGVGLCGEDRAGFTEGMHPADALPRRLAGPEPGWVESTDVVVVGTGVAGLT